MISDAWVVSSKTYNCFFFYSSLVTEHCFVPASSKRFFVNTGLKGQFDLKTILSLTHPQVWVSFFCWAKKKNISNQTADGNHWLPQYFFQWLPSSALVTNILQNIFCAQQKIEAHTCLEQIEGEEIVTDFHFWENVLKVLQRTKQRNFSQPYAIMIDDLRMLREL